MGTCSCRDVVLGAKRNRESSLLLLARVTRADPGSRPDPPPPSRQQHYKASSYSPSFPLDPQHATPHPNITRTARLGRGYAPSQPSPLSYDHPSSQSATPKWIDNDSAGHLSLRPSGSRSNGDDYGGQWREWSAERPGGGRSLGGGECVVGARGGEGGRGGGLENEL